MGLSTFIDALAGHLASSLQPAPALVGGVAPVKPSELPAITLAVTDALALHPGVGRTPTRTTAEGALRVDSIIDLANPRLTEGTETITLLWADRRNVQLPHGSVVRADGTHALPFTGVDLSVALGATTFTVRPQPPAAGSVSVEPIAGVLTFGSPLPANGTLRLGYFVGLWDVEVERFSGEVAVRVTATDAPAVEALTRQVEAALSTGAARPAGIRDLQAVGLGAVDVPIPAVGPGRSRTATYRFDFERSRPLARTSGGAIRGIEVAVEPFDEPFTITREETQT